MSLLESTFFVKHPTGKTLSYRDRIYIVKDIILKLAEYGELNQTALMSFCGLNINKHRSILEKMQYNDLVARTEKTLGKKAIAVYKCTPKGFEFCKNILEPYESIFPR
jgi:predicted transcriptional regulator